jgi:hypothetical protein
MHVVLPRGPFARLDAFSIPSPRIRRESGISTPPSHLGFPLRALLPQQPTSSPLALSNYICENDTTVVVRPSRTSRRLEFTGICKAAVARVDHTLR